MRPSTLQNIQFVVVLVVLISLLLLVSWNEAGAQITPMPTPVCTMTPDGEQCTSSVAMTVTPSATVQPPPFVPTMTPTATVTPTAMPTATATPVVLSPLPMCVVEACVWMPIGRKP